MYFEHPEIRILHTYDFAYYPAKKTKFSSISFG